jgi:hypothetical protein
MPSTPAAIPTATGKGRLPSGKVIASDPMGDGLKKRRPLPHSFVETLLADTKRPAKAGQFSKSIPVTGTAMGFYQNDGVIPLRALGELNLDPGGERLAVADMARVHRLLQPGGIGKSTNGKHRREPAHQPQERCCIVHFAASRRSHSATASDILAPW